MNDLRKVFEQVCALAVKYNYPISDIKEIDISARYLRLGESYVMSCHINLNPKSFGEDLFFVQGDSFKSALQRLEVMLIDWAAKTPA